jgi:hypothetical protein
MLALETELQLTLTPLDDSAVADTDEGADGADPGRSSSSDSPGWKSIKKPSHPVHMGDAINRTAPTSAAFSAFLPLSLFITMFMLSPS